MRASQIALLSMLGALALIVVALVAFLRMALLGMTADAGERAARDSVPPGETTTRTLPLAGYRELLIDDTWHVEVEQSNGWSVAITYPENFEAELDVSVDGARLVLDAGDRGTRGWWGRGRDEGRYSARIAMPELDGVEVRGSADIEIAGFSGDELRVTLSGASNIEGRRSRYETLRLTVSGAGNVDFRDLETVDAEVHLSGATNVRLAMDGGVLSGELSGVGNVEYTGQVSDERVRVAGFGRVGRGVF